MTGGTRVPRRLVLILGALAAFGPLSTDMYLPGLPQTAHSFGASASAAQVTLTTSMIGLAVGQMLAGPASDVFGRRRPLLIGLAAFAVSSVLCAVAPSIATLAIFRLVQGLSGAAGVVIARAVVRDMYQGSELARVFSLLIAVTGLAPIVAPLIGAQLLLFTDWRGIFVVLGAIGVALLVSSWMTISETLAPAERQARGLAPVVAGLKILCRDRAFVGPAVAGALFFGAFGAYLAGSSFVLENVEGVSPQGFGFLFATNALGAIVASRIGARLAPRVGPAHLLLTGLTIGTAGSLVVLVAVLSDAGLAVLGVGLFVVVSCMGIVMPSAVALALAGHARLAGTAAGGVGLAQFSAAAAVAPVVGIMGDHSALPMGVLMVSLCLAALATAMFTVRRGASQPAVA